MNTSAADQTRNINPKPRLKASKVLRVVGGDLLGFLKVISIPVGFLVWLFGTAFSMAWVMYGDRMPDLGWLGTISVVIFLTPIAGVAAIGGLFVIIGIFNQIKGWVKSVAERAGEED